MLRYPNATATLTLFRGWVGLLYIDHDGGLCPDLSTLYHSVLTRELAVPLLSGQFTRFDPFVGVASWKYELEFCADYKDQPSNGYWKCNWAFRIGPKARVVKELSFITIPIFSDWYDGEMEDAWHSPIVPVLPALEDLRVFASNHGEVRV